MKRHFVNIIDDGSMEVDKNLDVELPVSHVKPCSQLFIIP